MATKINLVVNSITPSKNGQIFMVNTSKGSHPIRKTVLEKRGIVIPDNTAFQFSKPTVAVVQLTKKGEYVFPEYKGVAPEDSTRMNEQGEPVYKAGDKPKWESDGSNVISFVDFETFKAQLELEKLMAQPA